MSLIRVVRACLWGCNIRLKIFARICAFYGADLRCWFSFNLIVEGKGGWGRVSVRCERGRIKLGNIK